MAAPFLPQAQPVYPTNTNLAPQLALLGNTIGEGIAGYRKQSLLSDVLTPGPDGKVDHSKVALRLLQVGMPQEAATVASMGNQQFNQALQQQQIGLQGRQVGVSEAQLKIAQEAEKRAAGNDLLKKGVLGGLGLLGDTVQPQPTAQAPVAPAGPPIQQQGSFTAGTAVPQPTIPGPAYSANPPPVFVPGQPTGPATFDNRFSGLPASGGVPRRELALSIFGYGDAAKLMAEERKNQPDYIARTKYAGKVGEQRAEQEQEEPKAQAAASVALQAASKAAREAVRLSSHPGLGKAVGPAAWSTWTPSIREDTINFETDLESLSTKVFTTAINQMRELSKTGGAVGSVTEKEMDKLANSWRNMSLRQGEKNMQGNLRQLAQDFNDSMQNIAKSYELQYGKKMQFAPIKIPGLDTTKPTGSLPPPPTGFVISP